MKIQGGVHEPLQGGSEEEVDSESIEKYKQYKQVRILKDIFICSYIHTYA
jgi:hypothetical protein